jgi:hypothetical protein
MGRAQQMMLTGCTRQGLVDAHDSRLPQCLLLLLDQHAVKVVAVRGDLACRGT